MKHLTKALSILCLGMIAISAKAGNKAGNGDYCTQKGANCERIEFSSGITHPQEDKIKQLIKAKKMPADLKRQMLSDLDESLVIYSGEKIKVSDLYARYYMQVVEKHTETITDKNGNQVTTEKVIERLRKKSGNSLGIYINYHGYKLDGSLENTYVRAVTEKGSPDRVIYFTEFVNSDLSEEKTIKLVLHEQAHRLAYLAKYRNDERVIEGYANLLYSYLMGEKDYAEFKGFLITSNLYNGEDFSIDGAERDKLDPSLISADVYVKWNMDNIVNYAVQNTKGDYSDLVFVIKKSSFPGIDFLNRQNQVVKYSVPNLMLTEIEERFFEHLKDKDSKPIKLKIKYREVSKLNGNQLDISKKLESIQVADERMSKLIGLFKDTFRGFENLQFLKCQTTNDSSCNKNYSRFLKFVYSDNYDDVFLKMQHDFSLIKRFIEGLIENNDVVTLAAQEYMKIRKNDIEFNLGDRTNIIPKPREAHYFMNITGRDTRRYKDMNIISLSYNPSQSSEQNLQNFIDSWDSFVDFFSFGTEVRIIRNEIWRSTYGGLDDVTIEMDVDSRQEENWLVDLVNSEIFVEKLQCLSSNLPGSDLKIYFKDITYDSVVQTIGTFVQEDIYEVNMHLPAKGFKNAREKLYQFVTNEVLGKLYNEIESKVSHKVFAKNSYYFSIPVQAVWSNRNDNYLWEESSHRTFGWGRNKFTVQEMKWLNAVNNCQ